MRLKIRLKKSKQKRIDKNANSNITTLGEIKKRQELRKKIVKLVKQYKVQKAIELISNHDEVGRDELQIVLIKALLENKKERKAREIFDLGFIYPNSRKTAEALFNAR